MSNVKISSVQGVFWTIWANPTYAFPGLLSSLFCCRRTFHVLRRIFIHYCFYKTFNMFSSQNSLHSMLAENRLADHRGLIDLFFQCVQNKNQPMPLLWCANAGGQSSDYTLSPWYTKTSRLHYVWPSGWDNRALKPHVAFRTPV